MKAEGPERKLSFIGHLDELRYRILICLAAVIAGTIAAFSWAGAVIQWLKVPAGALLPELVFLSPAEAFIAYLKVALVTGLTGVMPVLLYQVWAFVQPGLADRERRYGAYFVAWGSLLFLIGIAFAYTVLLPAALRFLLGFGSEELVPMITVDQYLGFVTAVLTASGFVFELPLVVFFLTKIRILHPELLRRQWRSAVVIMALVTAVLTPTPDIMNMLLILVPMLVLYEISIWVSWLAVRDRPKETDAI